MQSNRLVQSSMRLVSRATRFHGQEELFAHQCSAIRRYGAQRAEALKSTETKPSAVSADSTKGNVEPHTEATAGHEKGNVTISTTVSSDGSPSATVTATAVRSEKIPDIPSRSLGLFEEGDAKDPNMWKKYAWKYLGAVFLFISAYEGLHWFTRKVEEEAKGKGEGEQQQASGEGSSESPSLVSATASTPDATIPVSGAPSLEDGPLEYFEKLSEMVVKGSSELDELNAYKSELQEKLRGGKGLDEQQVSDIKEELDSVQQEIKMFEAKSRKP